jgi:hypothetical protein
MMFDFKNATPEALRVEYNRIAKEIGDDQFFTKKELRHLPEVLADGEQILAFTSGLMEGNTWLITLTDRRLIFLDKGMIYGLKQVSIDLDKVNAIGGNTRLIFGSITVEDGARARVIDNVMKRCVVPFTNKARDAIEKRKRPSAPPALPPGMPQQATPQDDLVSKLERLLVLKEKGLLTQDEMEHQKARLLAAG